MIPECIGRSLTGIGEVFIFLLLAHMAVLEVLILYLDELNHGCVSELSKSRMLDGVELVVSAELRK